MKLRNKKTGEIEDIEVRLLGTNPDRFVKSLAELNAEWEDAPEEPKPWWYIDITLFVKQGELFLSKHVEQFKTVGNYFETREEAEKAVEKLKAWKRLKDKKIFIWLDHFDYRSQDGSFNVEFGDNLSSDELNLVNDDLDLFFGGEE